MFRLGVIEESLLSREVLRELEQYFVSQRIEIMTKDECPVWHTNEYAVPQDRVAAVLDCLRKDIKPTWYIHAFDDSRLYVVLLGRCFQVALHRDETWEEMMDYGVQIAQVERSYLENIPLSI